MNNLYCVCISAFTGWYEWASQSCCWNLNLFTFIEWEWLLKTKTTDNINNPHDAVNFTLRFFFFRFLCVNNGDYPGVCAFTFTVFLFACDLDSGYIKIAEHLTWSDSFTHSLVLSKAGKANSLIQTESLTSSCVVIVVAAFIGDLCDPLCTYFIS